VEFAVAKMCIVVPQSVTKTFWDCLYFRQTVVSCSIKFSKVSLDEILLYQEEH